VWYAYDTDVLDFENVNEAQLIRFVFEMLKVHWLYFIRCEINKYHCILNSYQMQVQKQPQIILLLAGKISTPTKVPWKTKTHFVNQVWGSPDFVLQYRYMYFDMPDCIGPFNTN
jgi:hypothetical protein